MPQALHTGHQRTLLYTHIFRIIVRTKHRPKAMPCISDTPYTGANILSTGVQDVYSLLRYCNNIRSLWQISTVHQMQRAKLIAFSHRKCHLSYSAYLRTFSMGCRSQWPRGLRRRSTAARLLRLWVQIPLGACLSVVSVVCCQLEVSATQWSCVQRSPTDCDASLCVI